MAAPVATVLLVFGRGVVGADGRWMLTPAAGARVRAAVDYVAAHPAAFAPDRARIVFTGGWAEASEGAPQPPDGFREADLMRAAAREAGLDRHADLRVETRSRSTLENLLHTAEDGLLDGHTFTPEHPLGLVSHRDHLPRIRILAGRVLGLHGAALLDVPAAGGEVPAGRRGEPVARAVARLGYLGVRDAAGLLRRERRLVALMRRAERVLGVRRARARAARAGAGR
jgi:uncharacterized SAM-binding protein YcdF (DUF218 family)